MPEAITEPAPEPEETTYGDYQAAAAERRFKKPMIHKAKPADNYARPGETIYEFTDGHSGGLISLARNDDDQLVVDVYRTDDDVIVRSPIRGVVLDESLIYSGVDLLDQIEYESDEEAAEGEAHRQQLLALCRAPGIRIIAIPESEVAQ